MGLLLVLVGIQIVTNLVIIILWIIKIRGNRFTQSEISSAEFIYRKLAFHFRMDERHEDMINFRGIIRKMSNKQNLREEV